ncbi:hypothetical protein Tdes44962_MAKER06994 [Teratosphaeria destructans]|uniref:Uncharacterized protein n=1 Tax=Teratosphaeria destructans TaxID=418781 RepID=A0A9W7T0S8_9PEZI|nr:hypothetical protein Tdes44962_MAKER06994 [Teratosphaeria destructans]
MSDQSNFDSNAAEDAGYAAGRVEGDFDQAGQDVREDEQRVENIPSDIGSAAEKGFSSAVQGVQDVPGDIGKAVEGAAGWVGDEMGGAESDVSRAEGDVKQAEGSVQQFGDSVDQSYDQGEQEGRSG